jgi:hypothetical protein
MFVIEGMKGKTRIWFHARNAWNPLCVYSLPEATRFATEQEASDYAFCIPDSYHPTVIKLMLPGDVVS